jgi:hypothetical protein
VKVFQIAYAPGVAEMDGNLHCFDLGRNSGATLDPARAASVRRRATLCEDGADSPTTNENKWRCSS